MSGRRAARVACGLVACVTVVACSDDPTTPPDTTAPTVAVSTPSEVPSDGVLTIGMLSPITGPGSSTLGAGIRLAVEEAVVEINAAGGVLGNSVRLLEADEAHAGGFAELIEGGADAIVGPVSSRVALAELGTAISAGTVVCSPTATALALDAFPGREGLFFRTAPSDSLQMEAIVREVRDTGVESVAVAYLDDPYGRGLVKSFEARVRASTLLSITERRGFSGDQEDLSDVAEQVSGTRAIVVLGDADDGGRLLTALDAVIDRDDPPTVIVNDAVRSARQPIAQLSPELRSRLVGVAPRARVPEVNGFFTANAIDCVNLIALAATQADSDRPQDFGGNITGVSFGGSPCDGFAACAQRLADVPQIDYSGVSGPVDLRLFSGDLGNAWFDVFGFDENGSETTPEPLNVTL